MAKNKKIEAEPTPAPKKKRDYHRDPPTQNERNAKMVRKLASKGMTKSQIARKLEFGVNALAPLTRLGKAWSAGRDDLAERICSESIESGDYRDRAMIVGKMNLFATELQIPEISDIPSLIEVQGLMLRSFAEGKVSPEVMNTFTKSAVALGQTYFDANVQEQLDDLKKQIRELNNGTQQGD